MKENFQGSLVSNGQKGNIKSKSNKLLYLLTGALAGIANGLFGGGGGMIVVPLLSRFLKMESKKAHATAILIILPMSILSSLLYSSGKTMGAMPTIFTAVGVTIGGAFGALVLSKLSSKWICIIFSIVMAIAGVKMLFF